MPSSPDPTLPPFLAITPPPVPVPTLARLEALYASTSSQRLSNPTGYTVNAQWWAGVLEEVLRSGWLGEDRLVVRVDEGLLAKLEDAKGKRPRGIGGVVQGLATTSPPTLHSLPHFLASVTPLHQPASLTYRLVGRPLWWAMSQLNPFGSTPQVEKEDVLWRRYGAGKAYVHMPLLEQAAALFTAHLVSHPLLSYTDSLHSPTSFQDEFAEICFPSGSKSLPEGRLSRRDCEVLRRWLGRDCGALVEQDGVIKLLGPDELPVDHPINEADRGTLVLLQTLRRVEDQTASIEKQITEAQLKVKTYLASQKSLALSHLRSKHALEGLLEKRLATAERLREVVRSIDQAKGDVEVMAAYETSTQTLKAVLADPRLQLDHVERTTDELAEAMALRKEVDDAVRVGGQLATGAGDAVDDDELARELEDLVEDQKKEDAAREARRKAAAEEERKMREKEEERRGGEERSAEVSEGRPATVIERGQAIESAGGEDAAEVEKWRRAYEDAQQRKREESARAEVERLKRDERLLPAE